MSKRLIRQHAQGCSWRNFSWQIGLLIIWLRVWLLLWNVRKADRTACPRGGSQRIASYTHPMDSFCPQIVIHDGILPYNYSWKQVITFICNLDTSIIIQ
jgi:cytochrome b561